MCSTTELCGLGIFWAQMFSRSLLVQGVGFEPTKHKAADLQSAGFDRSPIPARTFILTYCRFRKYHITIFVTTNNPENNPRLKPQDSKEIVEPQGGFEPANLPITNRLRYHCATEARKISKQKSRHRFDVNSHLLSVQQRIDAELRSESSPVSTQIDAEFPIPVAQFTIGAQLINDRGAAHLHKILSHASLALLAMKCVVPND